VEVDNAVYFFASPWIRPVIYAGLGWLAAVSLLGVWLAGNAIHAIAERYARTSPISRLCFGAVLSTGVGSVLAMALTVAANDSQMNGWYLALAAGFAGFGLVFLKRVSTLFHPPLWRISGK
jgi:hypothetical protein